jgi:hypothetical protein
VAGHSEEVAAATDEESRIALKILRARFLAPLGMTRLKKIFRSL